MTKKQNFDLQKLLKNHKKNIDKQKFIESIAELPRENIRQISKKQKTANSPSTISRYRKKIRNLQDIKYYKIMAEIYLQKLYQQKK